MTSRTLSESSTVDGTLGYGATLELYDRLGGTFTWLPSVGAVIGRGGTLWRIDDAAGRADVRLGARLPHA